MPEVIQDSAIEMKITYSGIIFVFGFYTQVVVVKQSWNWWRKKMEEPDNSLMVTGAPARARRRRESFRTLAHRLIFTQVLDTIDRWVKHVSKEATFAADYVNALVVIARRRKA